MAATAPTAAPILITGTAGFIGFHLATRLLDQGHEIVGYDNFNDYYSAKLKHDRHAILETHPRYTGIRADLCDVGALNDVFDRYRFQVVCHLAAQAGVRYSLTHPEVYLKSNLEGFLNILEACRHKGVQRLVYASSSSVYGGNTKLPFSETDPVDTPISLYAATKKANELMAHTYSHLYGLQTIGLRFFTVYGPWGRPDMAMWLFTDALLAGRPIQVFNHGRMRRDFTYVADIIAGTTAALFAQGLDRCEVFNLGNHRSEHLLDMIRVLGATLGVEPAMDLLPMQPGDVEATFADIDRARAKLGFEPSTPIAEGIPRFIAWYKNYHAGR
ncbi:MAG: NAD-dependent epimerase/dehydratase family protein [Candidatus Eisenbacteria bacterium]|jgi:UDP-glucuronate 4-epimerase|nr:NAD-dependent epimerase/dehydratase family protein [Candidatus Eisenbacteria bacterium]